MGKINMKSDTNIIKTSVLKRIQPNNKWVIDNNTKIYPSLISALDELCRINGITKEYVSASSYYGDGRGLFNIPSE